MRPAAAIRATAPTKPPARRRAPRRDPPVYVVVEVEAVAPDPKAARAVLDWLARRIG